MNSFYIFLEKLTDSVFPALKHRNFRLFWFGQMISLIGTWMQNIGQDWLVLKLTNSAFLLGVVSALQFLPMLFLSLFAGVVIDRFPKRKILIFTQTSLMVTALALATLTALNAINYWEILVLATIVGFINTIDNPARQSFIIDLVGKEDLMNAISLNSSIFNAARIIGPGIAGVLIGLLGYALCFYLNALSFIAVITGLILIDVKMNKSRALLKKEDVIADIKEGLLYIKNTPIIFATILMMAVLSTFAINFNVLVPVFAKNILNQNSTGYGFLMSSMGVGALIGALILASLSKKGAKPFYLILGGCGLCVFQILIGFQSYYWLTTILLALSGFSMITFSASANTTVQLNSSNKFRGRVMSVYSLVFGGVTPIGAIYAGSLAEKVGAHMTFIISGLIGIAYILYVVLFKYKKSFSLDIVEDD
ncbi:MULTISPECIES: MFS transporter [Thermoanaerobacterium]|uniref:Major facilitator superfamily protein n=2 Tax=Thermoanaerobacterium TaxID=28895 RepID=W9E887_9THEO|nr:MULTISPECIES: MFS transporter [Thermoanaerobacterium]AFK85839.1 major facilitator superfamily MFS_1 [Thermoanaerobacterium saccharolyticum JW/SL-YS485]ETO37952.1 major facilitator superfamily protein [Thermoanaerobacterium aotearoense SCUT27]